MPNLNHKGKRLKQCFLIFLTLLLFIIKSEGSIKGQLNIDKSWTQVVYLSFISGFDQLNSMSNQMIIESAEIDVSGKFSFETGYLPSENYIYRIHLSKKGDPPASLIIGGNDQNHLFFIANNQCDFFISSDDSLTLFGNIQIENSPQNQLLNEINKMVLFVDTTSFNSTVIKRELIEDALNEKLRWMADTCSFPLVALYAIYQSDFESNISENTGYYSKFLEKWSNEESPYFTEFRKKIPSYRKIKNYAFLFGIVGLILGVILTILTLKIKTKKQHLVYELTIQERKIFDLLQNGKSNKEISDELNISLSTVKSHVNSVFSKLEIKSRKEVLKFK